MMLPSTAIGDRRRLTIMLVFAAHGATVGTFFSRIAELRVAMGLSEAALGLALVGIPAGVLAGSLIISSVIERYGTRRTLLPALPFFAGGLVIAGLAVGMASLFAALFLFGLGLTFANIAANVEADRVEAATGRRLLNRGHGSWGVGFLTATLVGTGAVAAGVAPLVHFALVFAAIAAASAAVVGPMAASPPRGHSGVVRRARRLALPTTGVLLVMGFALSGFLLESSSRSWSVIYLRDDFAVAGWVATLTLPAFVITQTIGRFLADPLIDRYGPARVARALTVVSALGLGLAVAVASVPLALAGFALVGLGISTVQPQAMSAVARRGDRPSSENVAAFATLQTLVSFVAPPLFGLVASHFGVRTSFAMLLVLPVVALPFARFLEPAKRAETPAETG